MVSFLVPFLGLIRTNDIHLRQLAPTQLELTGRIAIAILRNLTRQRQICYYRVSLVRVQQGEPKQKARGNRLGSFVLPFSPSCTRPSATRALQAAARSAADGENAFLLCKIRSFRPKAFLLNLARLRDKFVNPGCRCKSFLSFSCF